MFDALRAVIAAACVVGLVAAALGACATGIDVGAEPDARGAWPLEDALTPPADCPVDPCELVEFVEGSPLNEYVGDGIRLAECLRAKIEACGECRTFYCDNVAINVCQRTCMPPEP